MKITFIILGIFFVLFLLSVWEVRKEATKEGTKLGFFGTIWRGSVNIFARLIGNIPGSL